MEGLASSSSLENDRWLVQSSKWNNYHQRITEDGYTLSIVSGRTDVPGLDNQGYFELAIWIDSNDEYDGREIRIVDSCLDFSEVAMYIAKFMRGRSSRKLMWEQLEHTSYDGGTNGYISK